MTYSFLVGIATFFGMMAAICVLIAMTSDVHGSNPMPFWVRIRWACAGAVLGGLSVFFATEADRADPEPTLGEIIREVAK